MPNTDVFYYRDDDGSVPVLDWILGLAEKDRRAQKKCFGLVKLLAAFGRELRRPRADYLRDGVFELRTQVGNVHYRILYGFVGKDIAMLSVGLTKESAVPDKAIELAVMRMEKFQSDPQSHAFVYEEGEDG
jgi:hypothetical protein